MNSVADGILLLDTEGTITWLSRSAETILEVGAMPIGTSVDLLLPLAGEPGIAARAAARACGGRPRSS